jgi:hypothetical protein
MSPGRLALLLASLISWPLIAVAQYGEQLSVDAAEYRSPSGRFVLTVEPADRDGKGSAEYHLLDRGATRWSREKPFTLFDARVSDDGLIAGYAYTKGLYTAFDEAGELRVIVIEPSGRVRFDHSLPRQPSRILHEDRGEPYVLGLISDPLTNRLVVRTSEPETDDEVWRPYRLSTGEALPPLQPESLMPPSKSQLRLMDARSIPGTLLTLVAWQSTDWERNRHGVRFTLVDTAARPVWSLELPDDWPFQEKEKLRTVEFVREKSPVLETGPRTFTVVFARAGQAVRFSIESVAKAKWRVTEADRGPFEPPDTKHWLADLQERTSTHLGTVVLHHRNSESPLRDVRDFEVDDQGRFGFLRRDSDATRFVLLDEEGVLVREVALDPGNLGTDAQAKLAWCGESRWVVVWSRHRPPETTAAWLDAETGAITRVEGFSAQVVQALAGRRDGGFVILERTESSNETGGVVFLGTSLVAFDSTGKQRWRVSEALQVNDDVAVTPSGRIGVIGPVQDLVQVFAPDGSSEATFDLEKSLGRKPNYPSGISADADGGFLCDDFGSATPLVRLSADGRLKTAQAPHYPGGRSTGRLFRVRTDRHGRLWGTDGEALLRLDEAGAVDRVVGPAPSTRELGQIASIAIDAADRIYAVDERTGSIHLFAPNGQPERVLAVEPGEVGDQLGLPDVTIASDGRVCLDVGQVGEPRHLCFGDGGRRIPSIEWPAVTSRRDRSERRPWWFQAGTGGFWVQDWTDFSLLDSEGRLLRRVEKRASGGWLRQHVKLTPGPDGGVVAVHGGGALSTAGWSLDVYDNDGSPRAGFDMPADALGYYVAYDGRRLALWHESAVAVFDVDGRRLGRLRLAVDGRVLKDLPLAFAADGQELWVFEQEGAAVHRFSLPPMGASTPARIK